MKRLTILLILATLSAAGALGCAGTQAQYAEDEAAVEQGAPGASEEAAEADELAEDEAVDDAVHEGAEENAGAEAGFDARLSQYEYPYEVGFFELQAQGQALEMAYMDVQPAEPNGEVVVLMHGKNFSAAYWERTIEPLVERGFRVIAPDQIGFGKSSKPEHFQFTIHALAHHTHELLESLGVEKASFVVHSMGGMIGARYALMYPDAVDKFVMVNPIGLEDWKLKAPYLEVSEWYARELKQTPDGVRAYMTESYFDGEWKPEYEPLIEVPLGWLEGPDWEQVAWNAALTYDMIFTQPVVYEFGEITQPTLLILGDRDRTALGKPDVDPEVAATMGRYDKLGPEIADLIPEAELVVFEGIGHLPQFEDYERYIEVLVDFLQD